MVSLMSQTNSRVSFLESKLAATVRRKERRERERRRVWREEIERGSARLPEKVS